VSPPFNERSFPIWKKLWNAIDIADVVVHVMDGRHPLFYQHPDLTDMVTKQRKKIMVSLLNKADLVAKADRARWTLYFQDVGVHAIWYSCKSEQVESKKDTQDIEKIYSTSQMLA
jgi:ribosome biogenesis GTPase A